MHTHMKKNTEIKEKIYNSRNYQTEREKQTCQQN